MVWLMNGTTVMTTGNVGANPGSPWHVTANGLPDAASAGSAVALADTNPDGHVTLVDHPVLFDGHLIF